MLRSSFFLFLLTAVTSSCGSFSTGPSGSGSSGTTPSDGGGGGGTDGGVEGGGGTPGSCPPSAGANAFCDNFDRDGDQLAPPWDFASPKGISLSKDGPAASPPGSLLIDVSPGAADQPTHVLKSFPGNRRSIRIETKVNFVEDGDGTISVLTIAIDSVGGGVLPYRLELWRQFKEQPWKLEEFRQPGGRNVELKDGGGAIFKLAPGSFAPIQAELDLDAKVFVVRIAGQQWNLEGLIPPAAPTRTDVKIGLPQAINVNTPFKVRFDDVIITPSR